MNICNFTCAHVCELCYTKIEVIDMSTDAKRAGNARHLNKMDDIKIRVPKGKRAELKEYAEAQGESLQGWIIRLLEADSGIAIR